MRSEKELVNDLSRRLDTLMWEAPERKPSDLARPEFVENHEGFNIVHFQDRFIAIAKSLGKVDLIDSPLEDLVAKHPGKFQVRNTLTLARHAVDLVNQAAAIARAEGRLDRRLDTLIWEDPGRIPRDLTQPELIEDHEGFSIVHFQDRFIAIAKSVGEVDLLESPLEELVGEHPGKVLVQPTLAGIRQAVATSNRADAVSERLDALVWETPRRMPAEPEGPEVIETLEDFNIVHFQGRFIALARSLGEVDLVESALEEIVAGHPDEIRFRTTLEGIREAVGQVQLAKKLREAQEQQRTLRQRMETLEEKLASFEDTSLRRLLIRLGLKNPR